jgi:uncharacterized protein DUF3846
MANKVEVGTLLHQDGREERLTPADGKKFSLTELQTAVNGYIELVPMRPGNGHAIMYCNEEGKYKDFKPNPRATALANILADDYLVGPVLIVRKEPV